MTQENQIEAGEERGLTADRFSAPFRRLFRRLLRSRDCGLCAPGMTACPDCGLCWEEERGLTACPFCELPW